MRRFSSLLLLSSLTHCVSDTQSASNAISSGCVEVVSNNGEVVVPEFCQPTLPPTDSTTNDDGGDAQAEGCETAFAFGDACFRDVDGANISRWGWSLQLTAGPQSVPIYAGAGQCDTSKGSLVGQATIEIAGSNVRVCYELSDTFRMRETHLYVGPDILPVRNGQMTVSPGQFTAQHDLENARRDCYELPGGEGDYVIAHAVVCGR